jgi:hypothetical protein
VVQAPIFDGLSFDPFALLDDGLRSAEVDIGRRDVVQALVVALMVVVLDERFDLSFEIAGQEVVFQQDAVFECLVPAFDLALGLRMHRGTTHMAHLLCLDIFGQFTCDVAGTIVAEQPGLVLNSSMIAARRCQGHVERIGDIFCPHIAAQPPGDDIAREVVEHGRQVHPAPANDLEVGKISLPHLVGPLGLGVELACCLNHDISGAGYQIMGLE